MANEKQTCLEASAYEASGRGEAGVGKRFLPILTLPFAAGDGAAFVERLPDDEERSVARAGLYYFRGEAALAYREAEQNLESESMEIRLSALLVHGMAGVQLGQVESCRADIAAILSQRDNARGASAEALCALLNALVGVLFHDERADMKPALHLLRELPEGLRLFALYGYAHALYLRGAYDRALGVALSGLALAGRDYPLTAIYLSIVASIAYASIKDDDNAGAMYDCAWTLAQADGFIEPFAEHHGLLQGQVERRMRDAQADTYRRIVDIVYGFSRGWMRLHNESAPTPVTDALTPYEFAIAMLAAKGRTNKEIADFLSVSVHSVKAYLSVIYQKVGVANRAALIRHVNK